MARLPADEDLMRSRATKRTTRETDTLPTFQSDPRTGTIEENKDAFSPVNHLSDEQFERYYMGMMLEDGEELAALEEHMLACADCQRRQEQEERYVDLIRAALRALTGQTSVVGSQAKEQRRPEESRAIDEAADQDSFAMSAADLSTALASGLRREEQSLS
jgi:hypothetical protein